MPKPLPVYGYVYGYITLSEKNIANPEGVISLGGLEAIDHFACADAVHR